MYPNPNKNWDFTPVSSLFPIKVRPITSLTRKLMKDFFLWGGGSAREYFAYICTSPFPVIPSSLCSVLVCMYFDQGGIFSVLCTCCHTGPSPIVSPFTTNKRYWWLVLRGKNYMMLWTKWDFFHALGKRQQFTNEQSKIFPLRWYSPLLTLIYNFVI